jgi:hypothetical protein
MHSVLFIIEKPAKPTTEQQVSWSSTLAELKTFASSDEEVEILGENLALIQLNKGLNSLAQATRIELSPKFRLPGVVV